MGDLVIIKLPRTAFLYETFDHGIDAGKQNNQPKKDVPNLWVDLDTRHINHENHTENIQNDAAEGVSLPEFEQKFFVHQV